MIEIHWRVFEENTNSGTIDPDDLCGSIFISDGVSSISDSPVYLENWFNCLVEAYDSIKNGESEFECDLVSEPDPLSFIFDGSFITIKYKKEIICGFTLNQLYEAIHKSGEHLIRRLKNEVPEMDRASVKKLEDFL